MKDEQKLQELLAAQECRYDFRGPYRGLTKAEEDNWWARQELVSDMRRPQEFVMKTPEETDYSQETFD